jgi:hypothetical protein
MTTSSLDGLNDDFRDILRLFTEEGVEFVIVGAWALSLHGVPRATGDMDLFVRSDKANAVKVIAALTRFGAPLSAQSVTADDFTRPGVVYQCGLPPRRIDILTEISGLSFDEVWGSRASVTFEGRPVAFIGRQAFIANKEAAGRPKDLADAARLKRTRPQP